MKEIVKSLPLLVKFNLKIIFAGKFIWFVLASLFFYMLFMITRVYQGEEVTTKLVYSLMFIPSFLLIFYPSAYGIQNDHDNRILEILFGIPNYRYKVWLLRLFMSYVASFILLIVFSVIAYFLLLPFNIMEMAGQSFFVLFFVGNMAFWISTMTHSGSGTSILIIVMFILCSILSEVQGIKDSQWDLFINPYEVNQRINPMVWHNRLITNRIIITLVSLVTITLGKLNLQRREKFM